MGCPAVWVMHRTGWWPRRCIYGQRDINLGMICLLEGCSAGGCLVLRMLRCRTLVHNGAGMTIEPPESFSNRGLLWGGWMLDGTLNVESASLVHAPSPADSLAGWWGWCRATAASAGSVPGVRPQRQGAVTVHSSGGCAGWAVGTVSIPGRGGGGARLQALPNPRGGRVWEEVLGKQPTCPPGAGIECMGPREHWCRA